MSYITSIGLYVPEWTSFTIGSFILGICLSLSAVATETTDPTPYSKFGSRLMDTIPSRWAMCFIYFPSVVVCIFSSGPHWPFSRFDLVHTFTFLHFFKRLIEVGWVHRYSGTTNVATICIISFTYTLTTLLDLLMVAKIPSNVFSPTWGLAGLVLIIVGEISNAYHHYLLRQLRKDDTGYHLPRGGMFEYAVAPHYFFEQLTYAGFMCLSQNIVTISIKFFPMVYLTLRSIRTHEWYAKNLGKTEKKLVLERKYLIPFVW
ncbi:3-oxo-5-alpha-steroid 4-dehydrogenase-domain-containing protein [Phycomyces nitens]|nr:3-oxo-5-alpha-steroid 4-dehydrogenase-domain-containing protein [Phycomyces nitens]